MGNSDPVEFVESAKTLFHGTFAKGNVQRREPDGRAQFRQEICSWKFFKNLTKFQFLCLSSFGLGIGIIGIMELDRTLVPAATAGTSKKLAWAAVNSIGPKPDSASEIDKSAFER